MQTKYLIRYARHKQQQRGTQPNNSAAQKWLKHDLTTLRLNPGAVNQVR